MVGYCSGADGGVRAWLQMNRWGYVYVENLTWVWLHPSASILNVPSPLVRTSHLTLFIFRKEGG